MVSSNETSPTTEASLFSHAEALVGEAPLWDPRAGCLWWTDLARGRLHVSDARGHAIATRTLGTWIGGIALDGAGGIVAAVDDGVWSVRGERVEQRAALELDARAERVNDAACDPYGRLWVSVVGTEPRREPGSLHVVERGEARRVLEGLAFPNGVDWSPDGSAMYVAESDARRISRFEVDRVRGRLGARSTFVRLPDDDGLPDGLAVDATGALWVAVWGAGEVRRYSPAGRQIAVVSCPAPQVSSCALGGPAGRTLYVTSATQGMTAGERSAHPLAGSVFAARAPAAGLVPRPYRDPKGSADAQLR
ncbi:SMP-30/gluconolactonase/LRE family protein [Conexibacter arvalis]|uniref:Sugar lactone lactonase YvrE n=1 Tax=Conexibacter arvalis TaxID=912552 RepID=A0A840IBV3_9ACTN|nr:SMP-30/gluconolactonase/LRE family protein [Conexibacter arvalis]MBB4662407.1 sugar lactone lactonase YvrE [Conexibacter arvalis]